MFYLAVMHPLGVLFYMKMLCRSKAKTESVGVVVRKEQSPRKTILVMWIDPQKHFQHVP